MIAVDTNVLVRLLVEDDHVEQSTLVAAAFKSDTVFIAKTVLLETAWLLRSSFGFGRAEIAMAFRRLAGYGHVTLEDAAAVLHAIDWFAEGMDFADALHLASTPAGATFVSFDRALLRGARQLPEPPPVAGLTE